jgi:hypothetical protein
LSSTTAAVDYGLFFCHQFSPVGRGVSIDNYAKYDGIPSAFAAGQYTGALLHGARNLFNAYMSKSFMNVGLTCAAYR